jgi:hypothetical protein
MEDCYYLLSHRQNYIEEGTKAGISILNGAVTGYEYHLLPHRLLTQNDEALVRKLLADL